MRVSCPRREQLGTSLACSARSVSPFRRSHPTPGGSPVPKTLATAKSDPVGTRLVRLADVPEDVRRKAALKLMDEAKDGTEWARLFELVWNPGDASGRIAA